MNIEQKDIEVGEEAYLDEQEYLDGDASDVDSCAALAIIDGVKLPTQEELEAEAEQDDAVQAREAKEYLGDSVYVYDEGGTIRMTTEDGEGEAGDVIFLEDFVVVQLIKFLKKREYI